MEVASIASRRHENYGNAKVVVNNPTPPKPQVRHISMNPQSITHPPARTPAQSIDSTARAASTPAPAPAAPPRSHLPRRPIGDTSFYRSETIGKTAGAAGARTAGIGSKVTPSRGSSNQVSTSAATSSMSAPDKTTITTGATNKTTTTNPPNKIHIITGPPNKTTTTNPPNKATSNSRSRTSSTHSTHSTGGMAGNKAGSAPAKKHENSHDSALPRESSKWGIEFSKEEIAALAVDMHSWREVKKPVLERKPDGSLVLGFDLSKEIEDPTTPQQFETTRRSGDWN